MQLREFNNLRLMCTFWLHLLEDSIFHTFITGKDRKEITIPGAPPQVDDHVHDDDLDFHLLELPNSGTIHDFEGEPSNFPHFKRDPAPKVIPIPIFPDVVHEFQVMVVEGEDEGLEDVTMQPVQLEGIHGQDFDYESVFTCTLTTYHETHSQLVSNVH